MYTNTDIYKKLNQHTKNGTEKPAKQRVGKSSTRKHILWRVAMTFLLAIGLSFVTFLSALQLGVTIQETFKGMVALLTLVSAFFATLLTLIWAL